MSDYVSGRCRKPSWRPSLAGLWAAIGSFVMTLAAHAQQVAVVEFDPAFLPGDGPSTLDISRFARGNPVLPGSYDVDVWMNGEWQARKLVRFEPYSGSDDAAPCVALDELVSFGMAPDVSQAPVDLPCLPVGERVASATTRFDVSEQRLDIEVPQAAMTHQRRGVVPPGQWDQGVTAGLLAWRTNMRHVSALRSRTAAFLGIDAGLNWHAWRLRHAGAWSGGHYRRRHGFAERQLEPWRSQLRVGDIALSDNLFAPMRLRGIGLASDPRMTADALSGYAPRVKGLAATRATVRVTQNGILLREVAVPAGPFEFDDLYAAGRGGDIKVDITESDGRHHAFRVPFFPVPELMREGHTGFALHAGRAMPEQGHSTGMLQATWRHGFPHDATLYAGWRQWSHEASRLIGGAVDTLAGAFAMDLTHSVSRARGVGRLWRVRHGKQWRDGTLVSVSASRGRDGLRQPVSRRIDVLLQRDLGDSRGALSMNVGRSWRESHGGATLDYAASWTRSWRSATVDVSLRRSRRSGVRRAQSDTSGQVGLSMPLAIPPSSATLHAAVHGERMGGGARVGVGGGIGDNAATLYGVTLAHDPHEGHRMDASLARTFAFGDVAATIDRSASSRALSLSGSGGVVFHPGGVTVAQRLGDATALVKAPGAEGARLGTHAGIRVDRSGYAVASHLTPFRWNSVDLDPAGLSLDVAFASTHRRVAPTSGAVILVPFDTQVARTMLVAGHLVDGAALPFGAEVADIEGRSVGVVGQAGRVFLRGGEPTERWTVRWADGAGGQCELQLRESRTTAAGDVRHIGVCE